MLDSHKPAWLEFENIELIEFKNFETNTYDEQIANLMKYLHEQGIHINVVVTLYEDFVPLKIKLQTCLGLK